MALVKFVQIPLKQNTENMLTFCRKLHVSTFVIIQSTCSDAAPSNQNISHSNESGRGNHSTGTFYRGKHSKVGAAEAYYLELLGEWRVSGHRL